MNRRRLLLSYLANSFSWELYSKVYFYNELVPTTINGKNVLNKAKISKIYGNGVIENQLVNPTPPTQTINGVTFTNNGDGSWTVNGTATANTIKTVSSVFQTISGHYYLICGCANGGSNSTYRLLESYTYRWADIGSGYIQTASSSGNSSIAIEVKSGTTCNNLIFKPQFKDLTLREGPGNEPTTLTDNRIQNILNRGYIPYNLGKYKGTDIGLFSTTKADTTALDTITFKAQLGGAINSHDTMEITKTNVVFTKNVGSVDLGSIAWEYAGANIFYKDISNIKNTADNTLGDIITPIYTSVKRNDLGDKNICISGTSIITKDSAYTNASVYKTAMSGTYAHYPLATPQVITIPRKHLGIVDLGSFTYTYDSANRRFYTNQGINNIKTGNARTVPLYCSLYLTKMNAEPFDNSWDMVIYKGGSAEIYIHDHRYTNATDFKNAMAGVLLFYETQDEVADITDTIDIESGGTIRANWFRWKENQLSPQNNYGSTPGLTITRNGGTFTINGTTTSAGHFIDNQIAFTSGHKYLVYAFFKNYVQNNGNAGMQVYNANVINAQINANLIPQNGVACFIATAFGTGNASFRFRTESGITFSNTEVIPQLIDLTLAELEDVTSINDPRIQEIIRLGYIPTNTTGTYREVSPSVLPNIELSVKCK